MAREHHPMSVVLACRFDRVERHGERSAVEMEALLPTEDLPIDEAT